MTCREALNLLPLFFDGELDAHQMRAVAMHSARCGACEVELRRMERMQELVSDQVTTALEEIDLSSLWPAVEQRLHTVRVPWGTRLRAWWSDGEYDWLIRIPAFAAIAALAILTFFLYTRVPQTATPPDAPQVAMDNAASIDSLDTDVDSVAVLNDPETRTTVLWVSDDSPADGEAP